VPAGDPYDPADSGKFTESGATQITVREWKQGDYVDVMINACGVYVGLLGLRATRSEDCKQAVFHFVFLVVVGLSWCSYSYYETYHASLISEKVSEINGME
tara:strand:- start:181 stop:483 length:303 start_codon:yes stop_codon:yes gene_type:complete